MFFYTWMPKLFYMSLTAGIAVVCVIVLRLFLKKAPKVISYALWGVVLFRLLLPVSVESALSIYNLFDLPTVSSDMIVDAGEDAYDKAQTIDSSDTQSAADHDVAHEILPREREQSDENLSIDFMLPIACVWSVGILGMMIYGMVSYIRLHRQLLASFRLRENIFIADHIASPFVMGLFRPKIYLPSALSEAERDYIILHEQHHIRRGDHIVRLLSFAALCLHWFNPLVWIAFILSGRDMEMSCDEAVLRKLGGEIRADYSASLIRLATGSRRIAGMPLAFGEGNTEGRIKNIAKWKKPAMGVIIAALIVSVAAVISLLTNPIHRDNRLFGAEFKIDEILYCTFDEYSRRDDDTPSICITADYGLWEKESGEWKFVGQMEPYTLNEEELAQYTAIDNGWLRRCYIGKIADSYIFRSSGIEEAGDFYLAFCTKKGEIMLGTGNEGNLFRLCRLESTFSKSTLPTGYLERSLTQPVGGDIEIFHTWTNADLSNYLIVGFMSDDAPYAEGVQLPSSEKDDMGFAVFYHNKEETGYRLLQCCVYEDAASAENGIYYCPDPAVLDFVEEANPNRILDVILINNDAIARAERIWEYADGTRAMENDSYLNGHQMLLYSRKNDRTGCRVSQYFYDQYDALLRSDSVTQMIPTAANVFGAFDAYLYIPMDGENYRYERTSEDPASVTKGDLIYTFTEDQIKWCVYAVTEYLDYTTVLAETGEHSVYLYRYSPSKAVDPARLKQAKKDGKIVLENGYVTSGQTAWENFYKLAAQGQYASADIVHYYTLGDPKQFDETYYEVYKEDYPALYEFNLTYGRDVYRLTWNEYDTEYVRTYKYLRVFEDTLPVAQSSKPLQKEIRYVLTDDGTASWEELLQGIYSSRIGDYIDFQVIYCEKKS